ncbi:hypothetical protein AHAS_Ahas02G0113300 [Arachis hypogaea]
MTWLRDRVAYISDGASPETLCQYARCYLIMLIGGLSVHRQIGYTCVVEMAATAGGFRSLQLVVMGFAPALSYLPLVVHHGIAQVMTSSDSHLFLAIFDLHRMAGLGQQSRDRHDGRMLSLHHRIDALTFEQKATSDCAGLAHGWRRAFYMEGCHPYRLVHFVEFHHVDRVKRQLRGQRHRPADLVNIDEYFSKTTRGDDTWWLDQHCEWYDLFRGRYQAQHLVTINGHSDLRAYLRCIGPNQKTHLLIFIPEVALRDFESSFRHIPSILRYQKAELASFVTRWQRNG